MYQGKKIICIIPARGGSKGLPKKNIRPLLGKPLIGWSIEQAKSSKYIDYTMVSTENKEIADLALSFDADVPFMRPIELAQDTSTTMDTLLHCISELEENGKIFDVLVLLEPTSPLREVSDIDASIEQLLNNEKAESVVGICKVESCHPDFLVRMQGQFIRSYTNNNFVVKRRQEIEDLFFFEGSLYVSYITSLKNRKNFYHEQTLGYIVPKWKSFEVDDLTDFIIIESLLKSKANGLL